MAPDQSLAAGTADIADMGIFNKHKKSWRDISRRPASSSFVPFRGPSHECEKEAAERQSYDSISEECYWD
ncbi:hypothetical protein BDBG_07318 [Blastomyces gilchristii SLH14081]|uniref:Uncharacterized protein n=1 Tax=Blastomyces gilchristii (strain SLH14081) TaxID=559298 RepID=A0A179UVS9_BLAGS|nr:uncharacterized protein BDBG_07318 [Blastomyces gilchristii SLH14081]EQL29762.1 hypothetical protein BDFG_07656 [Blastomyces dermatitidis ATCC 26199]OAT11903.1 hypothetical protein BDBG_07318 [Blastomyces gilchristii SLH14081]